jgi:transposase-like protein
MSKEPVVKAARQRFSAGFKQRALVRASEDGVAVAARELGL